METSQRRLAIFYLALVAILGGVFAFVVTAGRDEHPQPPIAGGYDVADPDPCFGGRFDVKQSGQFVAIVASKGVGGKLRLDDGHVTGDVSCADGTTQPV